MGVSVRDRRQTIDLTGLSLSPGQGRRLDLTVRIEPLKIAADEVSVGNAPIPVRIDVSRTAAGYALRLRFNGQVRGACVRCLGPAEVAIDVDSREVDQAPAEDEELLSPYVTEGELDLGAWARDALALALPPKLLCRPDCAGLCPVCGESLNDAEPGAHDHPKEPDPRWAKLRELQ